MNTKIIITLWISSCLLAATISGLVTKNYYTKSIPNNKPIKVSPVISAKIPTNPDLSCEVAKLELWHYNNDMPVINITLLEQTRSSAFIKVDGNIYMRGFITEAEIPIVQAESNGWRFGLGVTVGAIAVAGVAYGAVKLYDHFH